MIPLITSAQVEAFASMVTALAASFAAWQGIASLKKWRHEQLGTRKIVVAEEALILSFEIENAFRVIRSPMSYASESSDREPDSDESNIQKANRDLAFVTFNRMQEREALFEKVHACSLKVKVLFGEDAYNPFVEVRRCFGEVRVGARMLYRTPYGCYNDQSFVEKMEKRIWDHESDEPDSIEFKVRSAVKSIEERLSKELQMA